MNNTNKDIFQIQDMGEGRRMIPRAISLAFYIQWIESLPWGGLEGN